MLPLRSLTTLGIFGLSLVAAAAAFAQITPDAMNIGDGAKECAAAKAALYAAPHPAAFSAASTNIDIHYYHLDLTFPMVTSTVSGVVRIEGTVVDSPLSTLALDLASSMTVTSVKLADATPLTFSHVDAVLSIDMPAPVAPGGSVAVDVAYNGPPQSGGFGYFVFGTRAGDRFAWSLSEPYGAREWWPCKDHPSDKADSVRVTVTVPSIYRVGSEGLLVSETVNGSNKTFDWVSRYPISSYLVSVAIGDYTRYLGSYTRPAPLAAQYGSLTMPLDHLVYNDGSNALFSGWTQSSDMIAVYEEWFGPYPFANEKYGHSECTFSGGMEHQTMTSLGGSSISLVSHELAHQWYGDKVTTKTWPHVWLNEGFATYAALLYFQQRSNLYPGTYESQLLNTYNSALTASGTLVVEDTTSVSNLFAQSRVYSKGGMVLHMLRWMVGDAMFKDILKTYAADPAVAYGAAFTSDFRRVCEAVSGLDLGTFFAQWVETGTGYPVYSVCSFTQPILDGYRVRVSLHQTQTLPASNVNVFEMPVEIVVHTTGGDVPFIVQNNQRDQNFDLVVANPPTSVAVDPGKHILRADPIGAGSCDVTDVSPLAVRAAGLRVVPNPALGPFAVEYAAARAGQVELSVYDVAGRRVLARTITRSAPGAGSEFFDASSLAAGVYSVQLRPAHGEVLTRKLVVVR